MNFNLDQDRNKYRSTQVEWEIHDQIMCISTIININFDQQKKETNIVQQKRNEKFTIKLYVTSQLWNNLDQEGNMFFMHLCW